MTDTVTERVPLRVLHMECCGHVLCWVNPRMPTHCPECGEACYARVRSWVMLLDEEATLLSKQPNTSKVLCDARKAREAQLVEDRRVLRSLINLAAAQIDLPVEECVSGPIAEARKLLERI
jgi:hypothetical protein